VASACVLVGVSGWAMTGGSARAARRAGRAGFSGVGVGIAWPAWRGWPGRRRQRAGTRLALLGASSAWRAAAGCRCAAAPLPQRRRAAGPRRSPIGRARLRLIAGYGAFGFGYIIPATFLPVMAREAIADPAGLRLGLARLRRHRRGVDRAGRDSPSRVRPRGLWPRASSSWPSGVLAPSSAGSRACSWPRSASVARFMVADAGRHAGSAAPGRRRRAAADGGDDRRLRARPARPEPVAVAAGAAPRRATAPPGRAAFAAVCLLAAPFAHARPPPSPPRPPRLVQTRKRTMSTLTDRMPPIPRERMTEAQRAAADELIAGPRKGVKGPFVPLLRSPELMARLQKVGEYLRFAAPCRRASRSSRPWSSPASGRSIRMGVHVPLAIAAGTLPQTDRRLARRARRRR
jgi:hypothetical protein